MVTRAPRGFGRLPAAGHTRNWRICGRFPRVGQRHPRCPSNGRGSSDQNGPSTSGSTERLEARDMGVMSSHVWKHRVLIGERIQLPNFGVRTMSNGRVAVPVVVIAAFAVLSFGPGSHLGARPSVDPQQELAALRAEIDLLRKQQELAPTRTAGIAPPPAVVEAPVLNDEKRAAIVADVKRQLQTEMGLLPLTLIRARRHSFVELYSYDDRGASSYGTAGYLGNGYFITVKHGVVALGQEGASDPRVIRSITLMIDGRPTGARVVDAGDARVEVDPGDWAILEVNENIDLPALNVGLNYQFEFADPIFRLGNDYSKGIVVSTGYWVSGLPTSWSPV